MWYGQRRWYVQLIEWSSVWYYPSIRLRYEQTQVMKVPPIPFLSHVRYLDLFQKLTAVVNRLAGYISDAGDNQEA